MAHPSPDSAAKPRPRQPLYRQMVEALQARIAQGDYAPGTPAPSESALIAEFRVSSTTARRCLNELAQQGLVQRIQGKGTFVTDLGGLHATRQLGILYHDLLNLTDTFAANALRGVNEALSGQDVEPALLQLGGITHSADPAGALMALVKRHQLDELLLMSPVPPVWLEPVLAAGIPVAAANFVYEDERINCVVTAMAPAVRRLAERIVAAGHRRVVILRGVFPQTLVAGVSMSSAKYPDIEADWSMLEYRYFSPGDVSRLVTEQLASKHHPTAFLCYGYEAALETAAVLRGLGWSIPGDASVAFLGVPSGPTQFAGEVVPIGAITARATRSLLDRLAGGDGGPHVERIDTLTQEGATLGPPPGDDADRLRPR